MKLVEQFEKCEECRALARQDCPSIGGPSRSCTDLEKLAADRRKQLERSQNAAAPNTG
jgi:hypothetical protein